MNIFEGARRVGMVIGVVATIGTGIAFMNDDPYISWNYAIGSPGSVPYRISEGCPDDAAREWTDASIGNGRELRVALCFLADSFGEQRLIPYRVDEKGMYGNEKYSTEVSGYTKRTMLEFRLPQLDVDAADKEWKERKRAKIKDYIFGLAIGLGAFWILVATIGWIVRGFMGIPMGKDSKPSN